MKILFDIYHPAHVHLFKHSIWELKDSRHEVMITSRRKDITTSLLDAYGFDHHPISSQKFGLLKNVREGVSRGRKLLSIGLKFNPDIIVSRISPLTVYVSKIIGAKNLMFKDSDYVNTLSYFTHPFVDVMYIPNNFQIEFNTTVHSVDGFQELAYLHPNWFEPNQDILAEYDIQPKDNEFYILRFVAMEAHHDVGQRGFSMEAKKELVSLLEEHGTVYITSETELPKDFKDHRLPISPEDIHHILYYADLYVGDSQTMATEAAILGTPAIRYNTFVGEKDFSNFIELEETYKLLYSFSDEGKAIEKAKDIIFDSNSKEKWRKRRKKMISDKIDVTQDMIQVIEDVGSS